MGERADILIMQYYRHLRLLIVSALAALVLMACSDRMHIFEGVEGPVEPDAIFEPVFAGSSQFDSGEKSRLAILITEDDSHWLALATGLKTIGIPFRMTTDVSAALQHDMVMVYPQVTGLNMSSDHLTDLRQFVRDGGTLLGTNILGGGLSDMFGFEDLSESKSRYELLFQNGFVETTEFEEKGLARVKIGSATTTNANPGTNSFINPKNAPLARYENGDAAIIHNAYGKGQTYALGLDLGQLFSKGYNRRQVDISNHYANHYQPTLDAFLIFLEEIYKNQSAPKAVLGTVPDGKRLSFILSYDIDFSKSLKNAITYAQHHQEVGVPGTYFIQTKYVRDYNDEIFMDEEAGQLIQKLESFGAEIASHSVAHSNAMWDFEFGDGTEYYPDYRPFVQTAKRTRGATLMGELRVSKFLLDNFAKTQEVVSFRPGFLSNPAQMPQALASAQYKYSSSSTANVSLTHLPFQLSYDREFSAFSPIFEIPITVEDELGEPMFDRLDEAIQMARQIAQIGGSYVTLIHTDAIDSRLDFQKAIIEEVRSYAWMGSLREFGDWWSARNEVRLDLVEMPNGEFEIRLDAPKPIKNLTLELNGSYPILEASMPFENLQRLGTDILIRDLQGKQTITLGQGAI